MLSEGEKRVAIIAALAAYILAARGRRSRPRRPSRRRAFTGWRLAARIDAVMTDELEEVSRRTRWRGL